MTPSSALEPLFVRPSHLELPRARLSLVGRPLVMGIVNVTPDSFYDGGRHHALGAAVAHAEALIQAGADLLDIGGESTRPGAPAVEEEEELRRVLPVIEFLARRAAVPVSIDTMKAGVARRAIEAGAQIVNDVSGLAHDPKMAEVVAQTSVAVVLMHMRGTPRTMQQQTTYYSLMDEISEVLGARLQMAEQAGIPRSRVVLDPGIGFAKTAHDNLVILNRLGMLHCHGCALLVGASRKSFLDRLFGWPLEERLEGSLAAAAAAVMAGAQIVRVHDVKETRRVVDVVAAIRDAGAPDAT